MLNSGQQSESGDRLDSLASYILKLHAVGGVPLVLIGVGAVNMFLPYEGTKQLVLTIVLIVAGVLTWSAATYVAVRKWSTQMAIAAKQDEIVLATICDLAKDQNVLTDVLKSRIGSLRAALADLGVRWVGEAKA